MAAAAKSRHRDLIRNLPDPILSSIVSRLPLDEAVRTSLLSKRWYSIWKYVTAFDLSHKYSKYIYTKYESRVSQQKKRKRVSWQKQHCVSGSKSLMETVISSHQTDIISCRISLPPAPAPSSPNVRKVETFLKYLTKQKRVQELTLFCGPSFQRYSWNVSSGFLSSTNLNKLCLSNYQLMGADAEACVNLRTIVLDDVALGDDFGDLVQKWKLLETLTLSRCEAKKLKICAQSLKHLVLNNLVGLLEVDICSKELESLELHYLSCVVKKLKINAPKLITFHARGVILKPIEILEYCSGLVGSQNGAISRLDCKHICHAYLSPFQQLRTLSLNMDLNYIRESVIFSFVLRGGIHLKKLQIVNEGMERQDADKWCLPYSESTYWERREPCESISCQLKHVEIINYSGTMQETNFVKHIITNASVLKKLIIKLDATGSKNYESVAAGLMLMDRASLNLSIVLLNTDYNLETVL